MDTLVNRILSLAETNPDKQAVSFKNDTLSFAELAKLSILLKDELVSLGVEKNDNICFSATSKVETIALYFAVHMAGAVAVFLDKNATAENMAAIYETADAKILLTDKSMKDFENTCKIHTIKSLWTKVKEINESLNTESLIDFSKYTISPNEDDLADILFTSGTTGKPKGVMLSYKSVYNILQNTIEGIGVADSDIMLMPLPLNHSFALRVVRAVLYQGATLVLQNGFTFAKEVENNINRFGCNAMACVPASYEVMRNQMQDAFERTLGGLHYIEFGAGSLSINQRLTITKLLPNVHIFNTWGSSESGGAIFCDVSEVVKNEDYIGALGRPLEGKVQVKILDENGTEIQSTKDNPGRMALKGDMKMVGYWQDEETTKNTLDGEWLLTGDMAYLKDGYVFMLGRADNIINVGGEKVSPIEVENIAGQFAGITECACIGISDPDGILGQVPLLFVVGNADIKEDDIKHFLASKMERYKVPTVYRFIDKLPRNRMQKVDYKALRALWESTGEEDLMNPIVRNILSRRSIRRFTDQEIPKNILDMILKCGYYAPSGHNMQSWRFTVIRDRETIELIKEKTKIAAQDNKVNFYGFDNPKVLILVSNDERNPNGCQDASCAAENMMLAANSYGIGSVWLNPLMTLRNVSPVKELLDSYEIPENHVVWSMVALGYHESNGALLKKNESVVKYI